MSDETKAEVSSESKEENTNAETAHVAETDNKEEATKIESEVSVKTEPTDYGIEKSNPEDSIDWKKRYADSQREFEEKYKPIAENYNYFDSLVKEDVILAKQLEEAVARRGQPRGTNSYMNIDQIVEQKLNERLKPVQGMIAEQEERQRNERRSDVISFEKKYGNELFKNAKNNEEISAIRKEIGATALALHKENRTKSFADALEKAMIIHSPEVLIRKGENKALAGKASKDQASFSQETSDSAKSKSDDDMTPAQREFLKAMGNKYLK